MKYKLILILFCLQSAVSLCAQTLQWGLWAGVNYSQTPSGKSGMSNNDGVIGFQTGANIYYELKSHWTFISGLSFFQKGGDQELKYNYYSQGTSGTTAQTYGNINYRINYLVVPLKAGYKFNISENFSLLPHFGIGLAYGFNAGNAEFDIKDKGVYKWKPFDGYSNPGEEIKINEFNHFDINASIGLESRIREHFVVSLSYDHGLKKIQDNLGIKNSSVQLSVGYIF